LVLISAIPAPSREKAAGIITNPGGTSPIDSKQPETDILNAVTRCSRLAAVLRNANLGFSMDLMFRPG
jgi:hypothetical protein